jgi:hypothetical protein
MNLFEFLLVIVAIVLGLGITELLGGVVRILRGEIRSSLLQALWIVIVFDLQVQLAWGLWGLRDRPGWRYPEFVLLLLAPVTLYMAAALLFPDRASDENARSFLARNHRAFFLMNAAYVAETALFGAFLYGQGWPLDQNLMRGVVILLLVILSLTHKPAIHWIFALLLLCGHLLWTYQYTFTVGATPTGR